MPYEQRRGCTSQTAINLCHRQRSRRRIAAVSFLSNISLDGTHRDTNLRHFTNIQLPSSTSDDNTAAKWEAKSRKESSRKKFPEGVVGRRTSEIKVQDAVATADQCNSEEVDSQNAAAGDIKRSTSAYKDSVLESVTDADIYNVQPVQVNKLSSTSKENKSSNSNLSYIYSENDSNVEGDTQSIDKKRDNPNIHCIIGNLDSNYSLSRSNSKVSHVSNTIGKCASAGKIIATRVRSLTTRSNLIRNSMGNSSSSITNSSILTDEQTGKSVNYSNSMKQTNQHVDKENIGPDAVHKDKQDCGHPSTASMEWENIVKENAPARRRKISAKPMSTANDKGFSSCESLAAPPVSSGVSRVRKVSSSVSESSSGTTTTAAAAASGTCLREVKYLRLGRPPTTASAAAALATVLTDAKTSAGAGSGYPPSVASWVVRQASEGRLLLTTGRGAPVHVFSIVRDRIHGLSTAARSGDVGSRKRNVSGSRQLPTITDTLSDTTPDTAAPPNPYSAAGASNKLQEVSYSGLLMASPYFASTKRRVPSDQQHQQQQQHHHHALLSRCFSHDPTLTGGGSAALSNQPIDPATSFSQSASAGLLAVGGSSDALIGGAAGLGGVVQPLTATGLMQGSMFRPTGATVMSYPNYNYAPELLDDPELRAGKHRKLLRFPSYMTSLIDYAKPDELKREVNDKFCTKFPHVKITLSKLRSLKREMVHICQQSFLCPPVSEGCAMLTVAHAHAYFDSLCLSGAIEKTSRKPLAGACIMLSAKINDVKGDVLETLIDKTECVLRVERSELITAEFTALLSLQFSIHLPTQHVNTHYQRLLFEH